MGTKREAEALREQLRTELHEQGAAANPTRQRLEDFAESWLRSKRLRVKVSTANRYADALGHALPYLGALYVDAITVQDIEKWLAQVAPTAKAPTVNGWLRVVKTCVGDACVELGLPEFVRRVKPLSEPPPQRHGLTPGQLRRLLEVYDHDETRALISALAFTGMRWGEAAALRWEDIDLSDQVITVQRAHYRGAVSVPKNGKPRQVPVCFTLKEELKAHRDRLTALRDPGWEAGWCFATVGKRGPNKGKVRLRAPSSVEKPWRRVCEAASVRATPHDLRRTFVDLLRQAGVDGIVEQAIVGHADDRMRGHYSTVRGTEAARAVDLAVRLVE
jgi:integrase